MSEDMYSEEGPGMAHRHSCRLTYLRGIVGAIST